MLWLLLSAAVVQAAGVTSEWTFVPVTPFSQAGAIRWVEPTRGGLFQLDNGLLHTNYAKIRAGEPAQAVSVGKEILLPMPDGTLAHFKIVEAPIMETELAAKLPEIKTYAGQGIDDPLATVRLDVSPAGFHAQVLSPNGAVYVEPAYRDDVTLHVSYYKRDLVKSSAGWNCLAEGNTNVVKSSGSTANLSGALANKTQSGATLRTYRLAVACTGEYAAFFGGTAAAATSAIVTAVNRVDGLYETELAVRLVLVANNNLLVYTNAATDPYSNTSPSSLLTENQSNINSVIGSANYDIGHVFSTGGGGLASLGVVCTTSKAQGETGSSAPVGDAFYIDYVAHEMGHQFGANHTFNSPNGSCSSANRNASTAYEMGSGLTIMAYAGICSPDDLQLHSDPFFHGISLDEIQAYITAGGGNCSVNTSSSNSAPTVSAGVNYIIPASTPFVLTATGSDPNGDTLTYSWEEFDKGAALALGGGDNGLSPLFRPFLPTTSPVRFIPKLSSILANTNWNQEVLPTTSRTMTFRVTARDNRAGGGGVVDAQMTVTSISAAGPFVVTTPNSATNWSGLRVVNWNVAGTTNSPISASGVNIYLSTNSGATFPFLLASNVPNSGASVVVLPNLNSTQARIKVQGNGNIFFDINNADFTISPGSAAPFIQLAGTALISGSCSPTNGSIDPYETVSVNWTLVNFGSTATTNLVATLLATNGVYYPGAPQTYGVIGAGSNVTRAFTFIPAGTCGGSVTGLVSLVDGTSNLGTVATVFTLGTIQTITVTQIFNNASSITINDNTSATPYPSTIAVSGISTPVTKVTATINGWSHTFPQDVGMLLVGPNGQKMKLVGGAGSGTNISGTVLTFDDTASISLTTSAISSGTYLPTDLAATQVFNSPAPASPYSTTLAPLAASPNGIWSLYVQDFAAQDTGSISAGWSLKFFSTSMTTNCCSTFPQPTLTSTTYSNGIVNFSWNSLPGPQYQVQFRTNLILGIWQNLGASIPGTNTLMGITDSVTNATVRFYRVQVSP